MHLILVAAIDSALSTIQLLSTCTNNDGPFSVVKADSYCVVTTCLFTEKLLMIEMGRPRDEKVTRSTLHVEVDDVLQFKDNLSKISDKLEGLIEISWQDERGKSHVGFICFTGFNIIVSEKIHPETYDSLMPIISAMCVKSTYDSGM